MSFHKQRVQLEYKATFSEHTKIFVKNKTLNANFSS